MKVLDRLEDFTIAFDKLLLELAVGFSSSNLSAQVRKYGAEATIRAQRESMLQAKRRMKQQLRAFGINVRKPTSKADPENSEEELDDEFDQEHAEALKAAKEDGCDNRLTPPSSLSTIVFSPLEPGCSTISSPRSALFHG